MQRKFSRIVVFAGMAAGLFTSIAPIASGAQGGVTLRVLSGRADMVTGGDALVETSAGPDKFSASLNGRDVTKSFQPGKSGGMVGHIEGLNPGKNTLEVKAAKGSAKLELVDHAITGPVFSGPHQKPFVCQTEAAGLGVALDADCSVRTVVSYVYKSIEPRAAGGGRGRGGAQAAPGAPPAGFKPYDPGAPKPADHGAGECR